MAGPVTFDDEPPLPKGPGGTQMLPPVVFDDEELPKSGGAAAAKELAPGQAEQGERRRKLMELVAAKGEPGYGTRLADNFTLGLNRPLGGLMSVAGGGSWEAGVGAEDDYVKRASKNTHPLLGGIADVAGGLASGGPVKGLIQSGVQQVPSRAAKIGEWLLANTGSGVIEGGARNAEDARSAAIGAGVGGAVSGVVGGTVGALLSRLRNVQSATKDIGVASRGGGSQTAEREGSALFTKLDDAGIHFSGKETPELANKTNAALANSAYSRNVPDDINKVLKELNDRVSGGAMTFGDVRKIETQISNLKANKDPGTRALAKDLGDAIDDFMRTAKPTMPASSVGKVGPNDLADAKRLWATGSKAEKVEALAEKGMRKTSDPAGKLERNFEKYSDSFLGTKKHNPFGNNPEQMRLMDAIVEGNPKLSMAAKGAEYGAKGLGALGAAGAAGTGLNAAFGNNDYTGTLGQGSAATGALALGLLGGGKGLRSVIAEQGAGRVNDLIRNIVTGSTDKANAFVPRDALAKILAAKQTGTGAGRYSASYIDPYRPE